MDRIHLVHAGDEPVGGFIALSPPELVAARKADLLDLLKMISSHERVAIRERLAAARGLFATPSADEMYLSKIGVVEQHRGRGFGRAALEAFLDHATREGYARCVLDVHTANGSALAMYRAAGFSETDRTESATTGMSYATMRRDLDL